MVEMLIVVSVISILLGILYSAVRAVQRYSRESITRGELKNIEAAWKQYYAHYQCWPTGMTWNVSGMVSDCDPQQDADGDILFTLDAPFARMLEGRVVTNAADGQVLNSEAISFLELTRFDAAGAPVNAWGAKNGKRYRVKFDLNGDNRLSVLTNATQWSAIPRAVAVWTEHPDKPERILGSWER